MNSISQKIRDLRAEKGMSQKDLANILGISDRAVSKWENDLSMPFLEKIFKMAKAFRISAEYFNTEK